MPSFGWAPYEHGRKKVFSTRLDDELVKKLKHLAVDEDECLGVSWKRLPRTS